MQQARNDTATGKTLFTVFSIPELQSFKLAAEIAAALAAEAAATAPLSQVEKQQ